MAITIKHAKTDTIADWTQADLDAQIALGNFPAGTVLADIVLPSDWNNDHTISGTVPIANGGTGQTTATTAINALLPSQASQSGKVLSTDGTNTSWIAAGGVGTVTSVTGTAPVSVATGTTTPVISMAAATGSVDGYLTSTDWTTFNNKAPATSGTSILYGNGSGGFSNVTIGTNLTFSGGTLNATAGGTGDVVGPASATDNAITRFDTTTGKLIQNSTVTLDDTGNIINANSLGLDTTPGTVPTTVGTMSWDDGDGVPIVAVKGGNVNLQVGTQELARVYNDSGTTLTKGQVVYISGAQGNRVAVKLARADVEATSFGTIGLVAESIASGAEGFIIVSGALYKLDTTGLTAGATVYLSPTTAGAVTTTKPQAPQQLVVVGWVERVDNIVGSIYVKIDNGYELDELHDVRITSPTSGNMLIYDASTSPVGVWKNANLTAGTGISVTNGAGSVTVTNSAPDQTVAITGAGGAVVTGTYPNFTITTPSGTVTSVTGTAPIASTGGATPAISISQSSGTTDGYLSSTDWTTFNNKQPAGTYVTSVSATSPVTSSGGTTPTIAMPAATTSVSGYLTSTDWNTFNNKGSGTVTAVSVVSANGLAGTSSGGATPALTLSTTVTGLLKGNGTAISAATSGTDYAPATSGTSILYGDGAGGFSNVTVGSGLSFSAGTLSASGGAGVTSFQTSLTGLTPSTASTGVVTLAGTLGVASGGTGLTSLTANYIPYGNGTSALANSANFTYNNTTGDQTAPQQVASNGIIVNAKSIASSYTITASNNAMSVGPVTVATGQSVTVSSGSRWVVI